MAEAPMQIQNYLKKVGFPARRDALIKEAKRNDAPKEVVEALERLPDREFRNPAHVNDEMTTLQSSATKTAAGAGTGGPQQSRR